MVSKSWAASNKKYIFYTERGLQTDSEVEVESERERDSFFTPSSQRAAFLQTWQPVYAPKLSNSALIAISHDLLMETPEAKILEGPLCLLASHNALIGLFYFFREYSYSQLHKQQTGQ